MDRLESMLRAHPHPASDAGEEALECVLACSECADVCATCSDACLSEESVAGLSECIRLNQDCSDICLVTARIIARAGHRDRGTLERLLEATVAAARACAEECERHAGRMEHCRICAQACRACVEACEEMRGALVA